MSTISKNKIKKDLTFKKGDVYYVELDGIGSEQKGTRPVVIIQNDYGNQFSPTVIVAAISTKLTCAKYVTQVSLAKGDGGLPKDSVILTEQIRTLDKSRLVKKLGHLPFNKKLLLNNAIMMSLELVDF
jgi:mRNA interferase MazF